MRVDINNIRLTFECEDCMLHQDISPLDVVLCGVPMCQACNEEMSIEQEAVVKEPEV